MMKIDPDPEGFRIAEALQLLRTRKSLTQVAASQLPGAPDYRTLSHWETRRKYPSLKLLWRYLLALDLDFRDLQSALDVVAGKADEVQAQHGERLVDLERRVSLLERGPVAVAPPPSPGSDEPN